MMSYKPRAVGAALFLPSMILSSPIYADGGLFSKITGSLGQSSEQQDAQTMKLEDALNVIESALNKMDSGGELTEADKEMLASAFIGLKAETINPEAILLIAKLEVSMGLGALIEEEAKPKINAMLSIFGGSKKTEEQLESTTEANIQVALATWGELKTKNLNPLKGLDLANTLTQALNNGLGGEFSDEDLRCTNIASPYTLDDNIERIFKGAALGMLKSVVSQSEDGSALDGMKAEAKRLNWLPLSVEKNLGDKMHANFIKDESRVLARNDVKQKRLYAKADMALEKLLKSIEDEPTNSIELVLLNEPEDGARAAAGGYLYLNTGTLKSPNLEFLLAHEVSHILKGHHRQLLQSKLIDQMKGVSDLKNLLKSDESKGDKLMAILNFGEEVEPPKYTSYQLRQSDACAIRMVRNMDARAFEVRVVTYTNELAKASEKVKKMADVSAEKNTYEARIEHINTVMSLASPEKEPKTSVD